MSTNSKIRHTIDLHEVSRQEGDNNASSLDQVRDILFGREIRHVEGRLEDMRTEVNEQLEDTRAVLASRLHAFEEFMKKRLDDMEHRLQSEREKRSTALESMQTTLRDSFDGLQLRVRTLDDSLIGRDAATQQLASQVESVRNRLEQLSKELRMAVVEETQTLRAEKMDRETLVALFSELALRLGDNRSDSITS